MLVRLNQLDPRSAEGVAGWTTGGLRGSVNYAWPTSAFAFQVQALDTDERGQPVADAARRTEVRRALAAVVAAMARPGDSVVVRLDGPFGPGLLPAVVSSVASSAFSISAVQRLTTDSAPPQSSVRFVANGEQLVALCRDDQLALSAGVRLRAFPLPAHLVDPMLDTIEPDDERWRDLLPEAAGVVSTAADLTSVVVWTTKLDPAAFRARLAAQLTPKTHAVV